MQEDQLIRAWTAHRDYIRSIRASSSADPRRNELSARLANLARRWSGLLRHGRQAA